MASKPNNTANVSAGKGLAGGYFFSAPIGTEAPTDIETPLDGAFENIGFVSEDGIVFSTESDTEDLVDMNGDTMDTTRSTYSETYTVTFAEVNPAAQKILYGDANVKETGTPGDGEMTVHVKGDDAPHRINVFEGVLKNGRRWRRVIHDTKVNEMGDLTVASSELFGREATFGAFKDGATGDYYTDYYGTSAASAGGE